MNTDEILDLLTRIARRCERAVKVFDNEPLAGLWERARAATNDLDKSWCGNFIGRHSLIYTEGLHSRNPGERYSQIGDSYGRWAEYAAESIDDEIRRRAGVADWTTFQEASKSIRDAFQSSRSETLPILDALLSQKNDPVIQQQKDEIQRLKSHTSRSEYAKRLIPSGSYMTTWEDVSLGDTSLQLPPHLARSAWLLEQRSAVESAKKLSEAIRYLIQYLRLRHHLKGATVAKTEGKVFIGHGRSPLWRELSNFLQNRLHLEWDEFNQEATAGYATKERLEQMLDVACFAFLVMTAEDETTDGKLHARPNVIHEVGLFQGRLGFERAIIVLEEGCSEFSNVVGVSQIRFAKGNIKACFEDIRHVLEREKILTG